MKKDEEDVRLLDRCEARKQEWATQWRSDEDVPNLEEKPCTIVELKSLEEALPKKCRDFTKQRQVWDATDSTRQFLWI